MFTPTRCSNSPAMPAMSCWLCAFLDHYVKLICGLIHVTKCSAWMQARMGVLSVKLMNPNKLSMNFGAILNREVFTQNLKTPQLVHFGN